MEKHLSRCYPGVWKLTLGKPDILTPHKLLFNGAAPELLNKSEQPCPFQLDEISAQECKNGVIVFLPMKPDDNLYGFGLQFFSFRQNGTRKTLVTNADPVRDTGDSHAPVPFYVSTAGYGVLADTAKNVTFDCGASRLVSKENSKAADESSPANDTETLYLEKNRSAQVTIYVPNANGITLYFFADTSIKGVVERYNLFCGGGVMPPIWGLGTLYRCFTRADQDSIEKFIEDIRRDDLPISMLGLEPGWHSHSYSCSFKWSPERFPDPDHLIETANKYHLKMNLWEQAYVHPTADIYDEIRPYSGNYEVWDGLCPDFATPEANEIYGRQQGKLIDQGIDAVKLDECDGSDYTGHWYYPAYAQFPSGLSGEDEKNLYGALVQRTINREYEKRNLRTYSQVRANWSYAAPMGFVLYSDLYDHDDYLHGFASSTFCGLLWSPEIRECATIEEVIRRLQMVVLSPLSIVNFWMVPMPLWDQYEHEKNLNGELLHDDGALKNTCRDLLRFRNSLVPYLYTAFANYAKYGTPPFRALVMDYPDDPATYEINDSYMMGDSFLVAPITAGHQSRDVYLPEGIWYDFWTNEKICGNQTIHVETENIPLYVKENSVLPLSDGSLIEADTVIPLELRLYGTDSGSTVLIDDDRVSLNYRKGDQKFIHVGVSQGNLAQPCPNGYRIDSIRVIH